MPYTASLSHSAGGAASLYQVVKVSAERKRNAPLKSTTRRPASTSEGANSAETSCGVARNAVPAPLEAMTSTESVRRGASRHSFREGRRRAAGRPGDAEESAPVRDRYSR